jgi:hypothetical protein
MTSIVGYFARLTFRAQLVMADLADAAGSKRAENLVHAESAARRK